jgi:hypothetical protein
MEIKDELAVQLDGAGLADKDQLRNLAAYGVTTVDDLVGWLSADPESIEDVLGMTAPQVAELKERAWSMLPPETRRAFEKSRGREFPLGLFLEK